MSDTTETRTWAQRFAGHAGVEAPDGMTLGWRVVHADFRSRNGYRWPFPGGWATDTREGVDLRKETAPNDPCPSDTLGGVCLAITTRGAASGSIPLRTVLVTAHHDKDVLGADADKLRVKRALVLEVVDAHAYLYGADLYGADLTGANLTRANLTGANLSRAYLSRADLTRADLTRANLSRANLTGADLTGANLTGANLSGADLTGANLSRANLTGADLSRADLSRATLSRATADKWTRWPAGFDAGGAGVMVR